jgi:hypothetical protein
VKVAEAREHGQTSTKGRTGTVSVRAALQSGVQLRQGEALNRQWALANLSKRRDSLQVKFLVMSSKTSKFAEYVRHASYLLRILLHGLAVLQHRADETQDYTLHTQAEVFVSYKGHNCGIHGKRHNHVIFRSYSACPFVVM